MTAIPAQEIRLGAGEERISISPIRANSTSRDCVASTAARPVMLCRTKSVARKNSTVATMPEESAMIRD
ncbi:hypothetical protein D3C73_1556060 [compost metagenome]